MSEVGQFTIHLEQEEGYAFRVKFDMDQATEILMDEPSPLGQDQGPNAARLLTAATANCLSASLMFCLAKQDVPANCIHTEATCSLVRNQNKRLRVGQIAVRITANDTLLQSKKLDRCNNLFEDFCVVTASLREGISVAVETVNTAGEIVHKSE